MPHTMLAKLSYCAGCWAYGTNANQLPNPCKRIRQLIYNIFTKLGLLDVRTLQGYLGLRWGRYHHFVQHYLVGIWGHADLA